MAVERLPLRGDESHWHVLLSLLREQGIEAVVVSSEADLDIIRSDALPNLVFLDMSPMVDSDARYCVQKCVQLRLPVIALIPQNRLADLDLTLGVNDFVVSPPNDDELLLRSRQVLWQTKTPEDSDVIRVGDLVVNPANYEVALRGKRIDLRFKEYELLRLLANNPGRVYTRETLLSQIWGYDYFGGTRTVDVHIRRLRSKIEDADHSFIETIWNVGYRFRQAGQS